jgi:homoserine dehydrogenase
MANGKKKVAIFGAGIIGSEAIRQFAGEGYDVYAIFNSRQFWLRGKSAEFERRGDVDEMLDHLEVLCRNDPPDLGLFALPSSGQDAAENELKLVQPFLLCHTPVILAGKAALSKYPKVFEPHLPRMGINATVGGATRILEEMIRNIRFDRGHPSVVELVINGTLSYIMSNLWAGRPFETVVREAVLLKYAEPGVNGNMPDPLEIFRGEAEGDVPKKLLIILNIVYRQFIGRFVEPKEIRVAPIDQDGMLRVTETNVRKKFVVRIATKRMPAQLTHSSPGFVTASIEDKVFVCGGFVDVPMGSALDTWVPNCGPGNAVHGVQDGRVFFKKADGAGDLATVSTLVYDARRICPPN